MTEVIMPKMGDGMEEGTLLEWLKSEGDKVKSGEVIGTIQTDKATIELEAPGSGTIAGFLLRGGESISVGRPIAAILKEGESLPSNWGGAVQASIIESVPSGKPEIEGDSPQPASSESTESTGSGSRIKASPLAKKIAEERGIDLANIVGTGPGGRIVEKDVVSAKPKALPELARTMTTAVTASVEDKVVPLGRLRQITAKRTLESKQQVPHFYVTVAVDVERILALRTMFEEEESGKASINDFVVKACALSLRDMPEVNAVFQGASRLEFGSVHIGIAVAVPDGLTVPVIKNADSLTLRQISSKAKALASKAKDNKLALDELTGSTFSISNMGMLDVDNFIAIVNQPNSAILAIASVRKLVVATEDDEVEVRSRMNITCSFDHRVVDGAVGARFINLVKAYLENPTRLLG